MPAPHVPVPYIVAPTASASRCALCRCVCGRTAPGGWWKDAKHDMLRQHVLGVLVHSRPQHKIFLYTFNDSIKGGADVNIEGLRRTLAALYDKTPMPPRLDVQADNASDNKCWAVLLWFGMLVYHGYTREVYYSFLLVGHTHDDHWLTI